MVHVPAILDEFFKPKSIHHACSVARRSKVIQYLKVLVKRRYPCETCHINQGLWIYQKMIEYDKIMLRKMSRTDPILMAKNGKNCLQFFTEPRLMLQLPLFEKKKKIKNARFPHSIPMLNFLMETSPDLPLARPHSTAADPWIMAEFCFGSRDLKNDSIGGTSKSSDFFGEKNSRIWHHTEGLAGFARLKKWNVDEYCLFKSGNMWKWCNPAALRFFRPSKKGAFTFEELESWLQEMFNQPSKSHWSFHLILVGWWGFPVGWWLLWSPANHGICIIPEPIINQQGLIAHY